MNDKGDASGRPAEAGPLERRQQGAAPAGARGNGLRLWWRLSLAAAAALMLVAIGFRWGRGAARPVAAQVVAGGGAGGTVYALLLYETDAYDVPAGGAEVALFHETSRWLAAARARKQFVTGEDFDTAQGWTLAPAGAAAEVAPGAAAPAAAVLSGMFLVSGDERQVLTLAEELPHLRHGGHVVVQKVIATDVPPGGD